MTRAITFLLLVGAAGAAVAAEPRLGLVLFQRLPIPDSVPAHLVSALAQDRDGFLWIGTQGGLVRYDGYDFRVYRSSPDDARTLSGSYVRALLPTSDGRLWVGTFSGGVSVFDPATEKFLRFRHEPGKAASLSHDHVEGLAEDREGRIWIATSEGLDCLDPHSGRIDHFRHDPRDPRSLADDRVRGLLVDRAGRLWVGSRDGLQLWRGARQGFERVASDPATPGSLAGDLVAKLFEDSQGRIWIGTTEHGAAVLDPRTGSLRRLRPRPANPEGLSHFWVYGFAQVATNEADEVWVATFGGGIDVVDARTLRIIDRLHRDATLDDTIGSDRIGAILRDRAGMVWIGTWGEGIARHDPAARAFRALRFSPNRPAPPFCWRWSTAGTDCGCGAWRREAGSWSGWSACGRSTSKSAPASSKRRTSASRKPASPIR